MGSGGDWKVAALLRSEPGHAVWQRFTEIDLPAALAGHGVELMVRGKHKLLVRVGITATNGEEAEAMAVERLQALPVLRDLYVTGVQARTA